MVLFLWSSQPFLFDISDKKKKKIQMESRSLQLETVKFDQNEKLMFRPPDKKYSLKTRTWRTVHLYDNRLRDLYFP